MDHLKHQLKNQYIEILIFSALFIISFWRLGSYPAVFDQHVDFGIHPEVNKVFDHLAVPNEISWIWQDMHLGQAGRSPLLGGLLELGLRLFGLTLFGVRIFPALFSFFGLIFFYVVMKKFYPPKLTLIFVAIFSTSPWYLTLVRSGGLTGFSLSLALVAICLVALFINQEGRGVLLPFLAGLAVALIPYGYVVIRPFFLLLPLVVIFYHRRIKKINLAIFFIVILAIASVQLMDLQNASRAFYSARGESTLGAIFNGDCKTSADYKMLQDNIMRNINLEFNFLSGLNAWDNFWNPPLAYSFWIPNIVVYPPFLVPFFLCGLLLCTFRFFKKPSMLRLAPLLLFGLAVLPGTVMSATGGPSISRDLLVLIPLYFFITYCIYRIYTFWQRKAESLQHSNLKPVLTHVLFLLIALICVYQVANFYSWGEIRGEQDHPSNAVYPFLAGYLQKNPNNKVLLEEFAHFGEYGAYAYIRCLGGKPIQDKIASKQIMLVKNENMTEMENLIKNRYFDIVVSSSVDQALRNLPLLADFKAEHNDKFTVFYLK
jgi:4-amino-4-deoxy-L-arabinose transferase-like glycosyltransferase